MPTFPSHDLSLHSPKGGAQSNLWLHQQTRLQGCTQCQQAWCQCPQAWAEGVQPCNYILMCQFGGHAKVILCARTTWCPDLPLHLRAAHMWQQRQVVTGGWQQQAKSSTRCQTLGRPTLAHHEVVASVGPQCVDWLWVQPHGFGAAPGGGDLAPPQGQPQ